MDSDLTPNYADGNCPGCAPATPRGREWLRWALLLPLCLVMNQCNGDGNKHGSSGSAGGVDAGQGGQTSGNASGGAVESGGARSADSAGGRATAGAGGFAGASSPASTGALASGGFAGSQGGGLGGVALTGGVSSITVLGGATGGILGTGGAVRGGSETGQGGASRIGGNTSSGGKTTTVSVTSAAGSTGGVGGASGGDRASTGGATSVPATGGATSGTFALTSPGWTNVDACGPTNKTVCPPLPTEITRTGAGTSPELHWAGAPEGTKSFVVLLQDLNNGTAHWILWNIPATVTMLSANVDQKSATPATPAGSQQCGKGTDAATSNGYYGPGAPCNVYEFVVYALGIATFSPSSATDQESVRTQLQALGASILGTASLRGRTNQGC
jgi:Raf kinase inhibitor-like YbhB/YbcL family protein